jgi:N-methylhydantoinase A
MALGGAARDPVGSGAAELTVLGVQVAERGEVRLAADIGGTFTDIVLDTGKGRLTSKLLTTPRAPEQAVINGTAAVLARAGLGFADIGVFVHGTTLATNAIIERRGAKTALIATDGFRDSLEIADEGRFDQYDVFIERPQVLIPRHLRFTVSERVDVHGAVRLALDVAAVRTVAQRIREAKCEAVAVVLMHGYANPAHEQQIAAILREECPGVSISLGSEVAPEAREYERTSTVAVNAYVQPLMAGYLSRLDAAFREKGSKAPIHLITSGGSLASLDTAVRFPVRLVESGPAGGAILAAHLAAERGENAIFSFDMGGTTAKICLIDDGRPLKSRAFEVDRSARFMKGSGLPVRIPVIEMVEIGAGGGSIASVDALQRILVGPRSAGSEPGPACYGRGGSEPTVTDADVVLGKVDPANFAGGSIKLDAGQSEQALSKRIGGPLKLDALEAAYGVAEIVDENMANAARVHAVERGTDIAGRTLIAFGGAAPLHACRLAEKLGITRIIVPADAGVGSAVGFLMAPAAYELVRSRHMRLDRFDAAVASKVLAEMGKEAQALAKSAAGGRPLEVSRHANMRYLGQGHEIAVALPDRALAASDAAGLREAFEAEYRRLFARHIPNAIIEIMSWSVLVTTTAPPPAILAGAPAKGAAKPSATRRVYDSAARRWAEAPVFARGDLQPGMILDGPAIVVEDGTSTVVTAKFKVAVDRGGALVLTAKE